jgi:hypothetical protein
MAEMGPGIRREDEDGRIAVNQPYASERYAVSLLRGERNRSADRVRAFAASSSR